MICQTQFTIVAGTPAAACEVADLTLELGSLCLRQMVLIDLVNLLLLAIYFSSLVIAACKGQFRIRIRARDLPFPCALASPCCTLLGIACVCLGAWDSSSPHGGTLLFVRGFVWASLSVSLVVRPTRFSGALAMAWWAVDAVLITASSLDKIVTGGNLGVLEVMSWAVSFLLLLSAIGVCRRLTRAATAASNGESEAEPLLAAVGGGEQRAAFHEAGFFSRLTFTWMDPLLRLGYSRPLDLGDIPPLDADDAAAAACREFLAKWHRRRESHDTSSNLVLRVLAECHKKELLLTALYTLLRTVSFAASPVMLYWFVSYSDRQERELGTGIALVAGLAAMKLVESLSQRRWFFGSRRLGMRMRSALMAAVFEKQLRLSSEGRGRHSSGEIGNYIAVDAYRLGEFPFWLHLAWSMPVQLALAIALLFRIVGAGALPGLAPIAICGVLNLPLAKMLQQYQWRFMQAQDERQRATASF